MRDTSIRALVVVLDELDKEVGYAEIALELTKLAKSPPPANAKSNWQPIATPPGATPR